MGNLTATDDVYSGDIHLYEWTCRGQPDIIGLIAECQAVERYCGDSVVDSDDGETCDDGNQISGDGCSSTCQVELIRLYEVTPRGDVITITNFGITPVDLSGYRLSTHGITTGIESLTVVVGSLLLEPSESVVLSGFGLTTSGGDLALWFATGALDQSGTMLDFVQR